MIAPILRDASIFGVNLFECGLAESVKLQYAGMMEGAGGVRRALQVLRASV